MSKTKKPARKQTAKKAKLRVTAWPLLLGLSGFLPIMMVVLLVFVSIWGIFDSTPQRELLALEFGSYERNKESAESFLENGDIELAKVVYSKTIDNLNHDSNSYMSSQWVDSMILELNPKSGVMEDVRTKTLLSEAIKSRSLYHRIAQLLLELGFEQRANDFELKALEIDPLN